uniref:Uncharacterized protein n=1 Tax=Romanomermis culicivorax TaxID=13658 RepID=A0A915IQM4_ROMCU
MTLARMTHGTRTNQWVIVMLARLAVAGAPFESKNSFAERFKLLAIGSIPFRRKGQV